MGLARRFMTAAFVWWNSPAASHVCHNLGVKFTINPSRWYIVTVGGDFPLLLKGRKNYWRSTSEPDLWDGLLRCWYWANDYRVQEISTTDQCYFQLSKRNFFIFVVQNIRSENYGWKSWSEPLGTKVVKIIQENICVWLCY